MYSKKWRSVASGGHIVPRIRLGRWFPLGGLAVALLAAVACGFPRPEEIHEDSGPVGCARDQDCGGATPYCVETVCVACSASASCPAALPVCDTTSHDCRSCVKDSECDSGACDLVAGKCVPQEAILYVSPQGSATDPCTATAPCSLKRSGELVDSTRFYVVLRPGHHSGGADFSNTKLFLIGDHASIDLSDEFPYPVTISNSPLATIRNVDISEHLLLAGSDLGCTLCVSSSELIIDNMHAIADLRYAVFADKATITHSEFQGITVEAGRLIADSCLFRGLGPRIDVAAEITNSIFKSTSDGRLIWLSKPPDGTRFLTTIEHNTFVGGSVFCEASAFQHTFDSNIFYSATSISTEQNCLYQYNLIANRPNIEGTGNASGDPQFKDVNTGDFHLKAGSPAIDAANPANLVARDFDGMLRPQGARSDIGAFERIP